MVPLPDLTAQFTWAECSSFPYQYLSHGSAGKQSACQCKRHRRLGFDPWVGKIPWRRGMTTCSSILAWEHGQRSLVGYSPQGCEELDMTEWINTHISISLLRPLRREQGCHLVDSLPKHTWVFASLCIFVLSTISFFFFFLSTISRERKAGHIDTKLVFSFLDLSVQITHFKPQLGTFQSTVIWISFSPQFVTKGKLKFLRIEFSTKIKKAKQKYSVKEKHLFPLQYILSFKFW